MLRADFRCLRGTFRYRPDRLHLAFRTFYWNLRTPPSSVHPAVLCPRPASSVDIAICATSVLKRCVLTTNSDPSISTKTQIPIASLLLQHTQSNGIAQHTVDSVAHNMRARHTPKKLYQVGLRFISSREMKGMASAEGGGQNFFLSNCANTSTNK